MATNCAAEDGEGADAAFCGLTKIAPARVSGVVEVKDLQRGDVTAVALSPGVSDGPQAPPVWSQLRDRQGPAGPHRLCSEWNVGRIYQTRGGPENLRWFWFVTVNGRMTRADHGAIGLAVTVILLTTVWGWLAFATVRADRTSTQVEFRRYGRVEIQQLL